MVTAGFSAFNIAILLIERLHKVFLLIEIRKFLWPHRRFFIKTSILH